MNDHELDQLIRQTHPRPEFSASFQREVWQRASLADTHSWSARWSRWRDSIFEIIAQPAPAAAAVVAMVLIGAGFGKLTVSENEAGLSRAAYVVSINPLVAAHHTSRE